MICFFWLLYHQNMKTFAYTQSYLHLSLFFFSWTLLFSFFFLFTFFGRQTQQSCSRCSPSQSWKMERRNTRALQVSEGTHTWNECRHGHCPPSCTCAWCSQPAQESSKRNFKILSTSFLTQKIRISSGEAIRSKKRSICKKILAFFLDDILVLTYL